jgi:hypothetical protein
MGWPPKVGEVLPQAAEAWCTPEKWERWVLAEHGHGPEWSRVFKIDAEDWERVWGAIAEAALGAGIKTVRNNAPDGITCGVVIELTIEGRTAAVTSSWHYAHEGAAPRLVTAYPRPYNRGHGSST